MADSACYIELASNAGDFFTNADQDDILIHPHYATQKILLGTSNSQIPSITVTSNAIGILKSSPAYPLDVTGDINFTGTFRKNGIPYVGSQWSNNNSNVFLGANSNVGIGKSNPAYPLDVIGDINYTGTFRQNGIPYIGSQWSNSSSNVFLLSSNVGIGKSNPMTALDVAGTVTATTFAGATITSLTNLGAYSSNTANWSSNNLFNKATGGDITGQVNIANNVGLGSGSPVITLKNNSSNLAVYVGLPQGNFNGCVGEGDTAILAGFNTVDTGSLVLGNWGTSNAGIRIDKSGNIAVGHNNPQYRLDVNGNMRASSTSTTTGLIVQRSDVTMIVGNTAGTENFGSIQVMSGGSWTNIGSNPYYLNLQPNGGDIYTGAGNVGIGTKLPQDKLHVLGAVQMQGTTTPGSGIFSSCKWLNPAGGYGGLVVSHGATYGNASVSSNSVNPFDVVVEGGSRLCVTKGTGRVGIGTNNPQYLLDVVGSSRTTVTGGASATFVENMLLSCDASTSAFYWRNSNLGIDVYHAGSNLASNKRHLIINEWASSNTGFVGIGLSSPSYKLDVNGDINFTGNLLKSGSLFSSGGSSQWTSSACNVYVGSTSNVGIGTTAPGYPLHVVGTIYTSGDIIAFSDERAKSNLEVISEPLSKVHGLTGYTYNMIESVSDTTKLTSKYTGLIAQQVMQVLPEAVHKDTDGKLSIAYGNIMGLVVEAIKAVDNKYKEEIQTLKNQMAQVLAKS
jgi:hypothetical protein